MQLDTENKFALVCSTILNIFVVIFGRKWTTAEDTAT